MQGIYGMQFSKNAVIENGIPIHDSEKLVEFDDKMAHIEETIDGKKHITSKKLSKIDETELKELINHNNKEHHSVIERLMEGFIRSHPEMLEDYRSFTSTARRTSKKKHAKKHIGKTRKRRNRFY